MSVRARIIDIALAAAVLATPAAALDLGPEHLVQSGGTNINVPGYSVPSFDYWDGDALPDLIVGEGGGGVPDGKVRVYLNVGTLSQPQFTGFFYAQSLGADLVSAGSG